MNASNLLIIDLETSKTADGIEVPVEIGLVAYSVEHRTLLGCFSILLYQENAPSQNVHRIPCDAVKALGWGDGEKIFSLSDILEQTPWDEGMFDYAIAHNTNFEKRFIETSLPWLCTYEDFSLFPDSYEGKRDPTSLAQWFGVGITVTHRAIYDCLLLVEVFNRVPDLRSEVAIARLPKMEWIGPKSATPPQGFRWNHEYSCWAGRQGFHTLNEPLVSLTEARVNVKAKVSCDQREVAKDWGFQWDVVQQAWVKLIATKAAASFPFDVEVIDG